MLSLMTQFMTIMAVAMILNIDWKMVTLPKMEENLLFTKEIVTVALCLMVTVRMPLITAMML